MESNEVEKIEKSAPVIHCSYNEIVDIVKLVPHPRNPNKHPNEQIKMLAKIMTIQGVRSPIVVSKRSGYMTKGHGRLEAAKYNNWPSYPVDYQDYDNEAQEYADMVADNKIAELAQSDMRMIIDDVVKLGSFDLDLLGIPDFKIDTVNFGPGSIDDQGKLDEKTPMECPNCHHQFIR